jgi:hypothetical protein
MLVQDIIQDLKLSVSDILETLEHSPLADLYPQSAKLHENSFSAASGTTIESGSIGSSASSLGTSLCSDDLRILLTQLQASQSVAIRLAAMKRLSVVSIGDLLADEFWQDSKRLLECGLLDVDIEVVQTTLHIYAHSFKSASHYMASEIYLSFIGAIQQTFESGTANPVSKGLDLKNPQIQMKLKQFRLLNQFMCELPSIWFRFSEKTFKEFVKF